MNPTIANSTRTALYLIASTVAIAAILWAESQIIYCVNFLRERTEMVSSDSFHLSDQLEVRMRELNDDVFRYSLQPNEARKAVIETEVEAARNWLAEHRDAHITPTHRELLSRAESLFARYNAHASLVLHSSIEPAVLPVWRLEKEKILQEMLKLTSELSRVEKEALSNFMNETKISMNLLYRKLMVSSLVLLLMGGALGYLAYLAVVVPLRARLRQTQMVMERQEKLSALGVLAAGVAHEIRNPLTSIKARLFTQQSLLDPHSEAFEDNAFITVEISRLAKIVSDFLAFARPSEPNRIPLNATQPFRDLEALVKPELQKAKILLKTDYQLDDPILADPAQLKQVLINLIQNAAESIGHDGTITLRTRILARRRKHPTPPMALLEIEDTGKGVTPEAQKRLFDPFFTTKPNGTGLGLSIAARILEKHDGALEYQASQARGAIFQLILPISTGRS